jgi:hypothetical protein
MTAARPLSGLRLVPAYLDRPSQEALLAALRAVFARAPLYVPRMPNSGKPLSVRIPIAGRSAGSPTKPAIATNSCIPTPASRGRRCRIS